MRFMSLIAAAALALVICSSANATVISYSGSTGYSTTDLDAKKLGVTLFDSTLGTLTSVVFHLFGSVTASGNIQNNAAQQQTFTVSDSIAFTFSDSGLLNSQLSGAGLNAALSQKYTNLASGPSNKADFGPFAKDTSILTLTAPLSAFQTAGGGTNIIFVDTKTNIGINGGGGNVDAKINTKASASYDVTYTYTPTPVPEPVSIALLGTGLVGLIALRRRA